MKERYETLCIEVEFHSAEIESVITQMWELFFQRVHELDYEIDRAIWICNRFPAWVAVKPGSAVDNIDNEPEFALSVIVGKLDAIRDQLREQGLAERDYRSRIGSIYAEYYEWLRRAIVKTFYSVTILNLRNATIKNHFGIYTTEIEDLHTSEIAEMDWVAGDKLRI